MKNNHLNTFIKKIKYISFFSLIFLLTACGSEEKTTEEIKDSTTKTSLNIENPYFNISLSSDWKILEKNTESFFQARHKDLNFVVHLIEPQTDKPVEEILNRVKNDFFQWKLIDKVENNQWSFSGKIEVMLPTRNFYQKLIKIPETSRYFLGSCSFEASVDRNENCKNILNSWVLKIIEN